MQVERRTKAGEKLEARETELAVRVCSDFFSAHHSCIFFTQEHTRLYGDEAPTESKELAVKIRELTSIVNGSKKALDDMVAVQAEFWKASLDL